MSSSPDTAFANHDQFLCLTACLTRQTPVGAGGSKHDDLTDYDALLQIKVTI